MNEITSRKRIGGPAAHHNLLAIVACFPADHGVQAYLGDHGVRAYSGEHPVSNSQTPAYWYLLYL